MKKILITGASGFVGSQIIAFLNLQGVKLLPVIRPGKEALLDKLPNIERLIITRNVFMETSDWWAENCLGVDTIIHTAWYTEPGKYLQSHLNADCLIGSINMAKGAVAAGVRRFIGIGTCFEYDLKQEVLSVSTELKPITPYAAAKVSLYTFLSQWLPFCSMEFSWCRLFYLYGIGENENRLVPYIRKQLAKGEPAELTSGNQIRDFMNISDAGKVIGEVALGNLIGPVNICSGKAVSIRQFAESIAAEYGRIDLLRFGARADNLIDPPYILGIPNY